MSSTYIDSNGVRWLIDGASYPSAIALAEGDIWKGALAGYEYNPSDPLHQDYPRVTYAYNPLGDSLQDGIVKKIIAFASSHTARLPQPPPVIKKTDTPNTPPIPTSKTSAFKGWNLAIITSLAAIGVYFFSKRKS